MMKFEPTVSATSALGGAISIAPAPVTHSVRDAARLLNMSVSTMYELIAEGTIRTYTVGRRRYISHEALRRFVAEREAASR